MMPDDEIFCRFQSLLRNICMKEETEIRRKGRPEISSARMQGMSIGVIVLQYGTLSAGDIYVAPGDLNVAQDGFPPGIVFHGGDFSLQLPDGDSQNLRGLRPVAV